MLFNVSVPISLHGVYTHYLVAATRQHFGPEFQHDYLFQFEEKRVA